MQEQNGNPVDRKRRQLIIGAGSAAAIPLVSMSMTSSAYAAAGGAKPKHT
jgi:hypothetical protein